MKICAIAHWMSHEFLHPPPDLGREACLLNRKGRSGERPCCVDGGCSHRMYIIGRGFAESIHWVGSQ